MNERPPTSHERMSGRHWDASYHDDESAPWDIGEPQPAVLRVADRLRSPVLDAGCGTGDNGIALAEHGRSVFGFDVAPTAVELANRKAAGRGLDAEFVVADALDLGLLGRTFATVVDSGLFHTFDRDEQCRYAASLATVTDPGSQVWVLCFADEGDGIGPHPVSRDDVHAAFTAPSWRVESIVADRVATNFGEAAAWLATITRV